ncbi:glycosyltransferase family 2 protein [Brenneria goodwinii]|uniref:Alpha-L-Rha alpha-1,3-L-rhamnosyltransferase n=1 Tax=Brenneria goodwinii TaxID=1109412 RepID=A0A0G4JPL1_9GAMM|nr:glycosyltransferase family 2 protein [Brenneria goodwinii]CPR13636.1 Alpha-L-Rha alpha-1,3-L-rhamnosyltransferase [Brenneria goodwinii]
MITVLMAAYNGEQFISEQIDSILNSNTDEEIKLQISLDVSTDNTENVLRLLDKKNIEIVIQKKRLGSAKNNFSWIIDHCNDDDNTGYYMLSDQDDVWLKNKINDSIIELKRIEKQYGNNIPCLVFTDSSVVDQNLNLIFESFVNSSKLDVEHGLSFKRLLTQNVGQGCTFAFNHALLRLVRNMPSDVIMHDWWIMLVASCFGKVKFISSPSMLYRQHSNNELGAQRINIKSILRKIIKNDVKESILRTQYQASLFLSAFGGQLDREMYEFIKNYSTLDKKGFLYKRKFLFDNKLGKSGIFRTIGFYLFI